jgi:hypothetical protein
MADLKKSQEIKIRKITQLYYSKPDIQKAMYEFCIGREISPRYFEGFGKRPDSFQYPADILNLAKNGATSFHCSEELWKDPLQINTDMNEKQTKELRVGWDLLIDIDCAHGMEFSILAAKAIVASLNQHGIEHVGIKFSGSKGFHILVPWKAFPKEINGIPTSSLFPEIPRKVVSYLRYYSEPILKSMLPEDFYERFKTDMEKRSKWDRFEGPSEIAPLLETVFEEWVKQKTLQKINKTPAHLEKTHHSK